MAHHAVPSRTAWGVHSLFFIVFDFLDIVLMTFWAAVNVLVMPNFGTPELFPAPVVNLNEIVFFERDFAVVTLKVF